MVLVLPTESNANTVQQQYADEARTRTGSAGNTKTENEGNIRFASQSGAMQNTRP